MDFMLSASIKSISIAINIELSHEDTSRVEWGGFASMLAFEYVLIGFPWALPRDYRQPHLTLRKCVRPNLIDPNQISSLILNPIATRPFNQQLDIYLR